MTTTLKDLLAEPAELLRPYRLPPTMKDDDGIRMFSSMHINWNRDHGLGYAAPPPDKKALNAFYSSTYRRVMNKRRGFDHYLFSPNYRAQTRSQVSWVRDVAPSEGIWLDVGAGFGLQLWTVKQMMPDWSLHAVEPDEEAIVELRKFVSVERDFPGFWEKRVFEPDAFDVISLSHVLEHLIDPIQSLQTLYYYLKPGGYLLIEVPNDHRLEMTSSKRVSDLPHLWFFSSTGLSFLMEEIGFHIERIAALGVNRPGEKASPFVRAQRVVKRKIRGPLALLDDSTWYAEGDDRCDLRILARKPKYEQSTEQG